MKGFATCFNPRKNAREIKPGKWIYDIVGGFDGLTGTQAAKPVKNQLCNVAEGIMDWFRVKLDNQTLHHSDIQAAYEEHDNGSCSSMGENAFFVGSTDELVYIPVHIMEKMEADIEAAQRVIITRHKGAVEWIKSRGFDGIVVEHLLEEGIEEGVTYIGVLPIQMVEKILKAGSQFVLLSLPAVAFSERGQELTPQEMSNAGATLSKISSIVMENI